VGGLGGNGSGRRFSATLKRGDQRQEAVPAYQPHAVGLWWCLWNGRCKSSRQTET